MLADQPEKKDIPASDIKQRVEIEVYNLINARIFNGISEILSFAKLPKDDKEEIKSILWELTRNIKKARQAAKKVLDEYNAQEILIQQCLLPKGNGPSLTTLNDGEVEICINFTKKALRDSATIIGMIFGKHKLDVSNKIFEKAYKKGRFDSILKDLEKDLPNDSTLLYILKNGSSWAEKFSLYRDEDEHPKNYDPFVINYKTDANLNIIRPTLYDETPLIPFLQETSNNILIFSEAILVLSSIEFIDDNMIEVIEIPEQKINPVFPKRFKVVPRGME